MKTTMKKIISVMLCALFVINLVPMTALARDNNDDNLSERIISENVTEYSVINENGSCLSKTIVTETEDAVILNIEEGNKNDVMVIYSDGTMILNGNVVETNTITSNITNNNEVVPYGVWRHTYSRNCLGGVVSQYGDSASERLGTYTKEVSTNGTNILEEL